LIWKFGCWPRASKHKLIKVGKPIADAIKGKHSGENMQRGKKMLQSGLASCHIESTVCSDLKIRNKRLGFFLGTLIMTPMLMISKKL